jgi:hypothetical protein
VALVSVAITGVLVPYFARLWQNRQKALDVQVPMVTDVSESTMILLGRLEAVHRLTSQLRPRRALGRERQAERGGDFNDAHKF